MKCYNCMIIASLLASLHRCFTSFSSHDSCILQEEWKDLNEHLVLHQRQVKIVPGDGFCLLGALQTCLQTDNKMDFTMEIMKYLISRHLYEHQQQYSKFHTGGDFLKDANEFLQTGKYWKEVVDVTVQVSAAALKINVHIYQSNQGLIQVLSHKSASEGKDVYIKYRRFATVGHYNAIIKDTSIPIPLYIPCAQGRGEERKPNYEKEEWEEDEEYINILLAIKTFPEFYFHSRRPL